MQQPAHSSVQSIPEEPYAVAATASTARPRRTLKHGDTFGLFDQYGDVRPGQKGEAGLYHDGTRHLSRFLLEFEGARPFLRKLRELREQISGRGFPRVSMDELSMGMSHDFEVAIEEGSTCVRVGTAIFGGRARP